VNLAAFAAVGAGAACGAWLRWGLGVWLNPVFALVPLGTLAANLLGGLLMGVALAAVQAWPTISPALKLLLTTGLLGGLTTFSTFSAEAFHLLQRGALGWLGLHVLVHVTGSVLMDLGRLHAVQRSARMTKLSTWAPPSFSVAHEWARVKAPRGDNPYSRSSTEANNMKKIIITLSAVTLAMGGLSGCANMNETQRDTGMGAAIGAVAVA
jgi:camphor resistance protein CrcB